jgi:hypothetical protein
VTRLFLFLLLAAAVGGCAGIKNSPPGSTGAGGGGGAPHADGGGSGGQGGPGGGSGGAGGARPTPLTDFPMDPIFVDPSIPTTAPSSFSAGTPRAGSTPCITSPETSTLMPRNWLRPRIDYLPAGTENLFEVTWTIPGFAHALRVYTRDRSYTLDRTLWDQMRTSVNDVPISVTIKALQIDASGAVQLGPSQAAQTSFSIAPVDAPGKIVYWALSGGLGSLKGFGIGEEGTEDVLVPSQVVAKTATETCIGCHAATPDGDSVGFALGEGFYYDSVADIRQGHAGSVPSYVTSSALATIRQLGGIPAYSPAHWSAGDRIALLSDTGDLHWIQLDGTNQGIVARTGDSRLATEPTFRHDGTAVVYVSGDSIVYGRSASGPTDLYEVPFAGGAGGPAMPLAGAAETDYTEYYPAYSPDDALVAFTRIPSAGIPYSNTEAEVLVVPSSGGAAVRLKANDAPTCQAGLTSPGLTNDWPKWSPDVGHANGKSYYWLTFSSQRTGAPQLFVTAVIVEGGTISTFPALYLWNQPPDEGNHTPSWDDFQIPPIDVP